MTGRRLGAKTAAELVAHMTAKHFGVAAIAFAMAACGHDGEKAGGAEGATDSRRSALEQGSSLTIPWGEGSSALGFRSHVNDGAALGVPAVAVGRSGVYLLDALHGRIVRLAGDTITKVASVPVDADDLAIGPDGAFAVRRSIKPEVLVFGPDGAPAGVVDTSAVEVVSTIALGRSRQVFAQNGFQETFAFGSPSMPQVAGQVLAGKREGAAFLAGGEGLVAVRTETGELELRSVRTQAEPLGRESARRSGLIATVALGKGSAARIAGTSGNVACLRLETVTEDAAGALVTSREAACVDIAAGKIVLRTKLPPPGTYVPRRELAFASDTLVFARPTARGLEVSTWKVPGAAR